MRLISMHMMLHRENDLSLFLASAFDLSFVSWYQRSFAKEPILFGARTACNRCVPGKTSVIDLPDVEARCFICILPNGIASVIIADNQYPQRVCFSILRQMHKDFEAAFDIKEVSKKTADCTLAFPKMDEMLKRFQDPKEADKLQKLKQILKDVEDICHKNLKDLMKRGEDLQKLMEKSNDMSKMSVDFYNTAKKTNSRCCSLI